MINVTKTFFPPIEEYNAQVQRIWENQWLTNRGALVLELEEKLKEYLSVSNIIIMNNGTIPIQIALKILGNNSEIITTPFSYVATTAAIVCENCTPVFVDIHPEYLTIDETKIEDAQKRIQHILSRLPDQGDARQLNLLSESASSPSNPNTPKIDNDDHDPTTH